MPEGWLVGTGARERRAHTPPPAWRRRLGCSRRAGHGDARHAWSWLRRSMLRPSRAGECRQMGPACCASPAGSRWLQSPRGEIWANCSCYTAPALRRGLHCRQQQVRRAPRVVARRPPLAGPPAQRPDPAAVSWQRLAADLASRRPGGPPLPPGHHAPTCRTCHAPPLQPSSAARSPQAWPAAGSGAA